MGGKALHSGTIYCGSYVYKATEAHVTSPSGSLIGGY